MEEFEKKLNKAKKGNSKVGWIFLIIAIILLVVGISQSNPDKESWAKFDGMSTGEYFKAEIYYLVGPFAEYTEDNVVTEELYAALTVDNKYILIATGRNTDLPVVGKDITEENIDSVEPVTIYGYGTILESDVAGYLVDYWNQVYEEEIFTESNYIQYFGMSYLNTKDQAEGTSVACYIFAVIFGILAISMITAKRKTNKNTNTILQKLEEEGKLEAIKNEYSKETVQEYKKLHLEMTENYIISYNPELVILPFADITNAYHSNMINGVYQQLRYIALETNNNQMYYIAPKLLGSKNPQFDEALEKIKSKIKQGGM